MKKNIALKIVLMLIIIASILCIKTEKVNAAYSTWGGSMELNAGLVAQSNQIYCRDYGGPLPYSENTYTYITDPNNSAYTEYNTKKAYIFNFMIHPNNTYSSIRNDPAQVAFWRSLTPPQSPFSWSTRGYKKYKEYHDSIKNYSSSNYRPADPDISEARYGSTRTYGPIKITYPEWKPADECVNAKSKYGLEFTVENNGVALDPQPTIKYENNEVYITFTQTQINSGLSRVTLKTHYSCVTTCNVKITPIIAKTTSSSDPVMFWCDTHRNWSYTNISQFGGDQDATILYRIPQSDYYYRNSGIVLDVKNGSGSAAGKGQ